MAGVEFVSSMVERGARALCESRGLPAEDWPTFVVDVEAVLRGLILPPIPVAQGGPPETHPDLNAWAAHRAQ